jgi:F0F1-type ATP synthase assembly protein I
LDTNLTIQRLVQSVTADSILARDEKQKVLDMLSRTDFLSKLQSGALGAGLAFLLAKFLKMSPRAQLLMTLAGYGIGRMLVDASSKHSEKFIQYNDRMKLYEIKD